MNLIFVENRSCLESALNLKKNNSSLQIVACTLDIGYELQERGISFLWPDQELDFAKFWDHADKHYDYLEHQCKLLDKRMQSCFPALNEYGIEPFYIHYFHLKCWLDNAYYKYMQISALVKKYSSVSLICFDLSNVEIVEDSLGSPYPMYYLLLKTYFSDRTEVLSVNSEKNSDISFFPLEVDIKLFRWIRIFGIFLKLKELCLTIFSLLSFTSVKFTILVTHDFFPKWLANRIRCRFLSFPNIEVTDDRIASNINEDNISLIVNKLLKYQEIYLGDVLYNKVRINIIDKINYYIGYAKASRKAIISNNYDFMVLLTGANTLYQIFAQQFKKLGKKVLLISHGAVGQHFEKILSIVDLSCATDIFVPGSAVKNYFEKIHSKKLSTQKIFSTSLYKKTQPYKCLPKRILCLLIKLNPHKPIFIFQGCSLFDNNFFLSYNSDGDFREYQRHLKLVDFFANNPQLQLIFKGHPNLDIPETPTKKYIYSKKFKNIRYVRNIPLARLVGSCDYFITDRPSTGMFEAMMANKTILSFSNNLIFWGEDKELMNSVHFFENVENLIDFIRVHEAGIPSKDYTSYVKKFIDFSEITTEFRKFVEEERSAL